MKIKALPLILALAIATPVFGAETEITAFGKKITLEDSIKIVDGRSYLPLREFGTKVLNADINWNSETKTAYITKGLNQISVTIGSNEIFAYNLTKEMDAPAFIENGKTYVPIRAIAESFNLNVGYENKMITISEKPLPQLSEIAEDEIIATMHTNMGDIKLRFFPEYAPMAVTNFLTLAENGYYNNVTFHRVIEDFVIQGGDPTATGTGGSSIWNQPFGAEISPYLRHFTGALCMANSGNLVSNGSQFYIVQGDVADNYFSEAEATNVGNETATKLYNNLFDENTKEAYKELGGCPFLDFEYTVFGQVIEGMDVVNTIAKVETDENDKPIEDVIITGFDIE